MSDIQGSSLSYKERAVNWVESLDDINIASIESIILKFSLEVSKVRGLVPIDREKLTDLEATLQYLNGVIKELCCDNVDVVPVESTVNDVASSDEYVFDSSPLVNYNTSQSSNITVIEKMDILSKIRMSAHVVRDFNNLKSKNNRPSNSM